jgi:MoxR-like ATPase
MEPVERGEAGDEPQGEAVQPETVGAAEVEKATAVARRIEDNIRRAVKVRDDVLEHVIVALLAEGHILVEDYPGVGKTALARALSRSIDSQFARIQCTADLLPADIVGTSVYNQREQRFEFRPGPIFANIVIVDEVNRASPKTQSGLLECMQERMVTVDVHSHELARPFLVFATQNPVEYEGTYPLPEAQVDRFMVRLELGYPSAVDEAGMLAGHEGGDRVLELQTVADRAEVLECQDAARRVHASKALRDYIVALLHHTRGDHRVELGASPRAGLMLLRAAKARALLQGRDHALPDDVQALASIVLSHRIMLVPEAAGVGRSEIVADAIASTPAL